MTFGYNNMNTVSHTFRYTWPVILGLGTFVAGMLFSTEENFRYTHGYYEVAFLVSLIAAIGYTIKLNPKKQGNEKSSAWYILCGFLICHGLFVVAMIVFDLAR